MPLAVVIVMSTVAEPAGAIAVIEVALLTIKLVAAAPPKRTAVAPAKPAPAMVTVVPPAVGPDAGETSARMPARRT